MKAANSLLSSILTVLGCFSGYLLFVSLTALAGDIGIGYQLMANPWKVSIADNVLANRTQADIDFYRFDSGSKVLAAMASGDIDIGVAGSSPIAAAVSRGLDVELFWIVEDIASAEALIVHEESDIDAPQDLRGKIIAVPFVSTTHFHMLFALEQFGIPPGSVQLLNMQPYAVAAAWMRGDIDATFIWHPVLSRLLRNKGKVLIDSEQLSSWGKATFDGMVVNRRFAVENPDFMTHFVRIIAEVDAHYRDSPEDWGEDSPMISKISQLIGGEAKDVVIALADYRFPSLNEQMSPRWLVGGKDSGAARALHFTAHFLHNQGKIDQIKPDYGDFVTPRFVKNVMAMGIK